MRRPRPHLRPPSPSTPRTPSTPFLSRVPGRGCWRGSSLLLLLEPPRKLQRDLTRAAHALALQRLQDSVDNARDMRRNVCLRTPQMPSSLSSPLPRLLRWWSSHTISPLGCEATCCCPSCCPSLLLRSWSTRQPRLEPGATPMRLMPVATAPATPVIATLLAHACRFSSNKKIRDRHELVKAA
jgi:hypothetical protein